MRSSWLQSLVFSATLLAAGAGTPARANRWFGETVYTAPVETVWASPTSYVVPTVYSVSPTAYYATAYGASPTAYTAAYSAVPTSYYLARRGLFGRRVVARPVYSTVASSYLPTTTYEPTAYYTPTSYYLRPTSYYTPTSYYLRPTSYYTPTTYDVPTTTYAPTSYYSHSSSYAPTVYQDVDGYGCESSLASTARIAPREAAPAVRRPRTSEPQSEVRPPSAVDSAPAPNSGDSALGSGTGAPRRDDMETPQPLDSNTSPPAAMKPAPDSETKSMSIPPATLKGAPKTKASDSSAPPIAPADDKPPLEIPLDPSDTTRREVRKPSNLYTLNSTANRQRDNVLVGWVLASGTRKLQEDVSITVSNRLQNFADRVAKSDALGRFAFYLPDGDWAVKVTMPSGRVYTVSELTVSNGKITDTGSGRDVPSLIIEK